MTFELARTGTAYVASIRPAATRELELWRARAEAIPDPVLRGHALAAGAKRGNMLGAALLSILAPRPSRRRVIRALVAFQAAYNYMDVLAEQSRREPSANSRHLHGELLVALDPEASHGEPYALVRHREDGGYLAAMVDVCRDTIAQLPSFSLVAEPARRLAAQIVAFQSLNLGERQGSIDGLRSWGELHTPPGSGLAWWETSAAGGSSLGVHALIALAADPALAPSTVEAVCDAYFPWIGALHSMLDSMIDIAEDERDGQRNLLSHYESSDRAAAQVGRLAGRAHGAAAKLPAHHRHQAVLAAMAGHYLSEPQAAGSGTRELSESVIGGAGADVAAAVRLLRLARRLPHGLAVTGA